MTSPGRRNGLGSFWRRLATRRLGAVLGVLALLTHVVIPLGQAVPCAGADEGTALPPAFFVICATYGTKTLPMPGGPDQAPNPGKAPSNSTTTCPVCQVQSLGQTLAAAAPLVLPAPAYADPVERTEAARALPPRPVAGLARPRGPPAA